MNRFDKFFEGLNLLRPFANTVQIEPIPNSFPNGAPAHSSRAYVGIECNPNKIWLYIEQNPNFVNEMANLGWVSEEKDTIWIFQ